MHRCYRPLFTLLAAISGLVCCTIMAQEDGATSNSNHTNGAAAVIASSGEQPSLVDPKASFEPAHLYPPQNKLIESPGDTTYFVDPVNGDDANVGTAKGHAWNSFAKLNSMQYAPGDKVMVAPGFHAETLKPSGAGSAEKPVVIQFAPGRHEFGVDLALRRPYFVSNSCDNPTLPRPIGILMANVRHFRIQGGGVSGHQKTDIVFMGRMIEFINDHAEDITYSELTFDLNRPTVSEFRAVETEPDAVVIQVAEGSTYAIENGKFIWTGDLGPGWTMVQQATPENGHCWRMGPMGRWDPFSSAQATELGGGKVRLAYAKGNMDIIKGRQFQFRNVDRDTVSAHNNRCRNITLRDCNFYALTGMGIVSQFTENITYQRVNVAPPAGTIRTCPAHADMFHFSGCRGDIFVDTCIFSGSQDDPINVHGTHLRILAKTADNQLLLRFMHPQTYGFAAFQPGDEIAVISHSTLRELPGNPRRKVTAIVPMPGDTTGKKWLLTLDGPVPAFAANDVVDNISWYPNFTARNCFVTMDSCRGFLITTRGKVLVEGCTFNRCHMPGILVEDDAKGWFESGPIRDMTIRNNTFIECGIHINPRNRNNDPALPVHENIRIEGNLFEHAGISAKSVKGLTVTNNRTQGENVSVTHTACSEVIIEKHNFGR